jgi:hypothetical protein
MIAAPQEQDKEKKWNASNSKKIRNKIYKEIEKNGSKKWNKWSK